MQGKELAIARFDRDKDHQKIHMEDFAQVFGRFPADKYSNRSYANIAAVLWAEAGEASTYEFFRRLIFSILIGNADMHLKNWSLLYPDKRIPVLSPAYDLVATLPYIPNDKLALNFGGSHSLSEITPDQVRRFAEAARLPLSPFSVLVIETMEKTVDAWKKLEEKEVLSSSMQKIIDKQIMSVTNNTQKIFKVA